MEAVIGGRKTTIFVQWQFPVDGRYKLNSDGASKGNYGDIRSGGLIRDDRGCWVQGFGAHIGHCTAFQAELWGALRGIQLAWELGI